MTLNLAIINKFIIINKLSFEEQTTMWRKVLNDYFRKSFKKIRISNKPSKKHSDINLLMEKRRKLKKKNSLNEKEEEELSKIELNIAEKCEDLNRKKVTDNFKAINGNISPK